MTFVERSQLALEMYQEGLSKLLEAMKSKKFLVVLTLVVEEDAHAKKSIGEFINRYMTRAEELKDGLSKASKVQVSSAAAP